MPHFTSSIDSVKGPVLKLLVYVSTARLAALTKANLPIPSPIQAVGLVDTGASCTSVDTNILTGLGIPPSGQTKIHTPSTGNKPVVSDQFDIGLAIFGGLYT